MLLYQVHFSFPAYADDSEFYAGRDSKPFLHEEDATAYMHDVLEGKVMVSCYIPDSASVYTVEVIESYTPSDKEAVIDKDLPLCYQSDGDEDDEDEDEDIHQPATLDSMGKDDCLEIYGVKRDPDTHMLCFSNCDELLTALVASRDNPLQEEIYFEGWICHMKGYLPERDLDTEIIVSPKYPGVAFIVGGIQQRAEFSEFDNNQGFIVTVIKESGYLDQMPGVELPANVYKEFKATAKGLW